MVLVVVEGSLEVKLPTIWTDEKQSRAEAERRERLEERRSEKRKSQKKEDAYARKGRKVAKHCVFLMICGSGGSKSRLAKAAGAEPAGQMRDEKLHAVVAGSTFPSLNVQNTPCSHHFWKLRCRKSARRCGAKHISKSKCTKHTILGPLLEVEMSKKCTLLWREAHFEVKMYKTHHCRTTFWKLRRRKSARRCGAKHVSKSKCTKHHMFAPLLEVQMSKKCRLLWREAHFEVKMLKTPGSRTTFGGSDVASLRFTTIHYATLHSTTLHYTTLHNATTITTQLHSTTLHYTKLHYMTLHYTTLHYTALPSTTLHYIALHCTPLRYSYNYTTTLHYAPLHSTTQKVHYTTLHYTTLHYTTLRYTTLHYTKLHYMTLHYTTLHYTALPSTTLHYIALHCTPLHYNYNYTTTLHYTPLHEITLHYTTLHYTTLHSTTLHYTKLHYITLHYNTLNDTAPQIDR